VIVDRLLLDTDVVIELLKKSPKFVQHFLELIDVDTRLLLSPIVIAEVYAGAFKSEYRDIEALFSLCERVEINSEIGRAAGMYANDFAKAFQGISLEDYLLAATARALACPLWTGNRKHYPMRDIVLYTP
jgi:predicted nucleic acid-binding protein